ncbi:TPR-like protein [Rickenella mellea]|uniref:TPR-like protein n=1 Tax=Rickenella mellea TaxID=50990 RepID=A0A4Y7PZA3_9AGAM|nr:TPR-like protein [Rickenella mellea]
MSHLPTPSTRGDQLMSAAQVTLAMLTNITDSLNVPFLKVAPQILNQIFQVAQNVKTNKQGCLTLASQAIELIQAIVDATKGRNVVNIDAKLERDMADLQSTLEAIRDFMIVMTQRNAMKRTMSYMDDSNKIAQFKAMLNDAVVVFDIRNQISVRMSQQELIAAVNSIHNHLMGPLPGDNTSGDTLNFLCEPPLQPSIFFGRTEYVANMISLILNNSPARLAVLGPGGVGKTSVAAAVINDHQIVNIYSSSRFFMPCDILSTAERLVSALLKLFGISVQKGGPMKSLLTYLNNVPPLLLVLDNLETLWDAEDQRQETQKLLENLASVKSLTYLVTLRGSVRPHGVNWTYPYLEPLEVLPMDAAKQTYLAIAPTTDSSLESLLKSLDCLPLAITLLANVAQMGFSPTELMKRWTTERTKLLNTGGKSRFESVEVSVSLSINSPLMQSHPEALQLLKIISYLPGGVQTWYLSEIANNISRLTQAQVVLNRTGLAYQTSKHVWKALSPIRFFILENYPIQQNEILIIQKFFCNLAEQGKHVQPNDPIMFKRTTVLLEKEQENITHVLTDALHQPEAYSNLHLIWGVIHFSNFLYWTAPSVELLQKTYALLQKSTDKELKAICLQSIGDNARMSNDYQSAGEYLSEAREQFKITNDKLRAAQCLRSMADVSKISDYPISKGRFLEAMNEFQAVDDELGVAMCLRGLADLSRVQNVYLESKQLYAQARKIFQKIGDSVRAAQCLASLGNVAFMMDEYSDAESALTEARQQLDNIGDNVGVAQCLVGLGDIARLQSNYPVAKWNLNEALKHFEKINNRSGIARCLTSLGNIAFMQDNNVQAEQLLTKARHHFETIGDKLGAAQCLMTMGDVLRAVNNYDEAKRAYHEAINQYQEINFPLGLANCLKNLGNIAYTQHDYTTAQTTLNQARMQFQQIGDKLGAAQCLRALGAIAKSTDEYLTARQAYEEARTQFQDIGDRTGAAHCLSSLATISYLLNDKPGARRALQEAVSQFKKMGDFTGAAHCFTGYGDAANILGDQVWAYSQAINLFQEVGSHEADRYRYKVDQLLRGNSQ